MVLSDGTYATQSAAVDSSKKADTSADSDVSVRGSSSMARMHRLVLFAAWAAHGVPTRPRASLHHAPRCLSPSLVHDAAAAVQPKLRKLLQKGDFFLGAVLASTLTKLALRTQELHGACPSPHTVWVAQHG